VNILWPTEGPGLFGLLAAISAEIELLGYAKPGFNGTVVALLEASVVAPVVPVPA
jgi:hypothetical protein